MITTGKKARKKGGNRFACKRAKQRRKEERMFNLLPVSCIRKNAPWATGKAKNKFANG